MQTTVLGDSQQHLFRLYTAHQVYIHSCRSNRRDSEKERIPRSPKNKSKAPGESLGNPNESEELPKKTKKETPGESLGNPNATATAGEDKKSLTKTTACEKKPDNTERPTNAQDRAGGPVQRRPEITDGVRLTG